MHYRFGHNVWRHHLIAGEGKNAQKIELADDPHHFIVFHHRKRIEVVLLKQCSEFTRRLPVYPSRPCASYIARPYTREIHTFRCRVRGSVTLPGSSFRSRAVKSLDAAYLKTT